MAEFSRWLWDMDAIHRKFVAAKQALRIEGIRPDPAIGKRIGGFGVFFRHPLTIVERVEALSERIAQCVTATLYTRANIHTCVTVVNQEMFCYDAATHEGMLCDLRDATEAHLRKLSRTAVKAAHVSYGHPLYNQTTVIAPGMPNQPLFETVFSLVDACRRLLPELALPWGSHITISRFLEERAPDTLVPLIDILEHADRIGTSQPAQIDVGYFEIRDDQFNLIVTHAFPFVT